MASTAAARPEGPWRNTHDLLRRHSRARRPGHDRRHAHQCGRRQHRDLPQAPPVRGAGRADHHPCHGRQSLDQPVGPVAVWPRGSRIPETGELETLLTVPTMFKAAHLVGRAIRQVYAIDGVEMEKRQMSFDVTMLLGGQIGHAPMRLYQIYSAGNAIEATLDTPFLQIGEPKYGKPILDRAITHATEPRGGPEARPHLHGFDPQVQSRRRPAHRHRRGQARRPEGRDLRTASRRTSPISATCASAGRRRCGRRTRPSPIRPM